ncbi:MAG: tetratricopeptide repeat protein [Acidobacteria bacterium]|nr:tetratricopeptide repeat protein [Acidobacteriota bacterium]
MSNSIRRVLHALAVLVVCSGRLGFPAAETEDSLRRAYQLFQQERFEEALKEFDLASQRQPGNAAIQNVLGIVLTKLGRTAEANQKFQRAIQLDPKLAGPHKNLAYNFWQAKADEPALEEFQQALRLDPGDEFVRYCLGMIYLHRKQDAEAVAHLEKAPGMLRNDAPLLLQLAEAYFRLNQADKALQTASLLESQPGLQAEQEYALALLLSSRGLYERALPRFRHLLKQNPESWANRHNLAIALMNNRNYEEATAVLQSLSTQRPGNAKLLSLLGSAYEAGGSLPAALEAYERAVKAEPDNEDYYLEYTRLLMDLDRYDESIRLLQQGLKTVQENYTLHLRLGATELMKGNLEKAEAAFRQAIARHPTIPLGYAALAKAYVKADRNDEAAELLKGALERLPADFYLEHYYGLVLMRLGRDSDAAAAFERAASINPNVPETRFELGKLLLKLERTERARKELERAIELNPGHSGAMYQLSRVYLKLDDRAKAEDLAARSAELRRREVESRMEAQQRRLSQFQPQTASEPRP